MLKIIPLLALLAFCQYAAAWDTERGLARPEIRGEIPAEINITGATAFIKEANVEEFYELKNRSNKLKQFTLWTVTEPASRSGLLDETTDQVFSELAITLSSSTLKRSPQHAVKAIYQGRDITRALLSMGIDPARSLSDDAYRSSWSRARWRELFQRGLMTMNAQGDTPSWVLIATSSWDFSLPANSTGILSVRYRLRPSKDLFSPKDPRLAALTAGHCGALTEIQASPEEQTLIVHQYRLPVGFSTWHPDQMVLSGSLPAPRQSLSPQSQLFSCEQSPEGLPFSLAPGRKFTPRLGKIELLEIVTSR